MSQEKCGRTSHLSVWPSIKRRQMRSSGTLNTTQGAASKYYESGEALAKDMGVPLSVLEEEHEKHFQAAKKQEKDPDGGSFPAYPSGKTWDEPSGKTGSGKKFFHNIIPGSAVATQEFFVAIITPVI